jgi:hypothetical protein
MQHLLRLRRVAIPDARLQRVQALKFLTNQSWTFTIAARMKRAMERLECIAGAVKAQTRRYGSKGKSFSAQDEDVVITASPRTPRWWFVRSAVPATTRGLGLAFPRQVGPRSPGAPLAPA